MYWRAAGRTCRVGKFALAAASCLDDSCLLRSNAYGLGRSGLGLAGIYQCSEAAYWYALRICLYLRLFDDFQMVNQSDALRKEIKI